MSDSNPATSTPLPSNVAIEANASNAAAPAATSDAARTKRVNNATVFLRNPQVKSSPLPRRVLFLKSKGLTAEEVAEAFNRVGEPKSMEAINDIFTGKTASGTAPAPPTPPPAAPTATSPAPTAQYVTTTTTMPSVATAAVTPGHAYTAAPPLPGGVPAPHVQYVYAAHPPPTVAGGAPQQSAASSAWSWKDYFIGATIGTVAAAGAVKAFTAFSPFDIVRKDQMVDQQRQWQMLQRTTGQSLQQQNAPNALVRNSSISFGAQQLQPDGSMFAAGAPTYDTPVDSLQASTLRPTPQPALPSVPQVASTNAKELAEKAAEIERLKGDLEKAEAQAKEAKGDLDKVRREKAEMAVTVAKLKAQITQLQRSVEKAELTVEAKVKERLEALKHEQETATAAGAQSAVVAGGGGGGTAASPLLPSETEGQVNDGQAPLAAATAAGDQDANTTTVAVQDGTTTA
jgi:peroxin-14